MDDRKIEELLKESWSPRPPDGMGENVLRRARAEGGRSWFAVNRWKLAFACGWLIVVLLAGALNRTQEARITGMVLGGKSPGISAPAPMDMDQWRRNIEGLLVMASNDDRTKGSDSL